MANVSAVSEQVKRIARKTDTLVDSGQRMKLDSREALRVVRQAEFEAMAERRRRESQTASLPWPFRWFLELLHH